MSLSSENPTDLVIIMTTFVAVFLLWTRRPAHLMYTRNGVIIAILFKLFCVSFGDWSIHYMLQRGGRRQMSSLFANETLYSFVTQHQASHSRNVVFKSLTLVTASSSKRNNQNVMVFPKSWLNVSRGRRDFCDVYDAWMGFLRCSAAQHYTTWWIRLKSWLAV